MKEILEKIYETLLVVFLRGSRMAENSYLESKASQKIENRLSEIKKLIDELPDEDKP